MPPRVFFALLLALGGAMMAGAQQPSTEEQPDNHPTEQKVIANPAEYEAYITALNTVDPVGRKAAFEAFLVQFPNSIMRNEALDRAREIKVITDPAEREAYVTAINTVGLNARTLALSSFLRQFPNTVMRDQIQDLFMDLMVQRDNQQTAALLQKLRAIPFDNLSRYTRCDFGPFKVEETAERDRPFVRTVHTAQTDEKIEVVHGISLRIAYEKIPFASLKAERLETYPYPNDKHALIESLRYLSGKWDMEATERWPSTMNGFQVYGINPKRLEDGVLSVYLLFHDADQIVVTLYLLNAPPESPKFRTLDEYRALRDKFLKTYTTCFDAPTKARQRQLSARP